MICVFQDWNSCPYNCSLRVLIEKRKTKSIMTYVKTPLFKSVTLNSPRKNENYIVMRNHISYKTEGKRR